MAGLLGEFDTMESELKAERQQLACRDRHSRLKLTVRDFVRDSRQSSWAGLHAVKSRPGGRKHPPDLYAWVPLVAESMCCTDLVHLGAPSAAGIAGHRGTISTPEASKFCTAGELTHHRVQAGARMPRCFAFQPGW
jgi:hypothetical protein